VPLRQLQYWSDASGWVTAAGNRSVLVGDNERSSRLSATVAISAS
jgi:beta-glucosidase